MKIKNLTFAFIGLIIATSAADSFNISNLCKTGSCLIATSDILSGVFTFSVLNLIILFILKWLPLVVFQYWWRFARYAIPLIFVLVTLINSGVHHDPTGQLQNLFDVPALILLYAIFTLGSVVQIVRGYWCSKEGR